MSPALGNTNRWLWLILFAGLLLRLVYALDQPTVSLYRHGGGGDSGWYLANGAGFFSGKEHGYIRGIAFYVSSLPTPPAYLVFTGIFQTFLPKHESVVVIRILQCVISVATAYLAYRITRSIVRDHRAGLIAAALVALHPAFIVESNTIATETLYIFFVVIGLWLYVEYVIEAPNPDQRRGLSTRAAISLTALAFGMATLTRAVAALFPLIIVIHMLMLGVRRGREHGARHSLLLLLVYVALLSTWTIHNMVLWNRLVIVSDQLMPAIWRAAITNDGSPTENDELLLQDAADSLPQDCEVDCKFQHATDTYVKQIKATVSEDPIGFVFRRLRELSASLLQPHGTIPFGAKSIRDAGSAWLQYDRSMDGLLRLISTEGFVPKLSIWFLHYFGIVLGLAGMWLTRRSWHVTLPLIGFLVYTALVHLVVLDSPRYLFPIEIIWLIFASAAIFPLTAVIRRSKTSGST